MDDPVKPPVSKSIEISVVVPVRDEAASIRFLLDGLLNQTLPPKEIVITDGGSLDATREIVEEYIQAGAPVKLLREPASLPGRARNVGVQNASCDWIAFTDAGIRPEPEWLALLAAKAGTVGEAQVVYGSFAPVTDTLFKECAAMAYLPPPFVRDGMSIRSPSIASALMRRQVWESVGGFPEHLRSAEDLLFMQRIEAQGFYELRAPEALVHWDIKGTLWSTFKRFVTYARNNIRAGLWRHWQAAIFQRYAVLALISTPAIFLGWRWLAVPAGCWILLLMARAGRALQRNRELYPAGTVRNVSRLMLLMVIIATLDLAAFVGSVNWLVLDKLNPAGRAN